MIIKVTSFNGNFIELLYYSFEGGLRNPVMFQIYMAKM